MNIEKYDTAVRLLQRLSGEMTGCRDLRVIELNVSAMKVALHSVVEASYERTLDLKEVPQFVGLCSCGESKIANTKFCHACGKRHESPSDCAADCG